MRNTLPRVPLSAVRQNLGFDGQLRNGELWQCCDNHMLLSKGENVTGERVTMGSPMQEGLKEDLGQC